MSRFPVSAPRPSSTPDARRLPTQLTPGSPGSPSLHVAERSPVGQTRCRRTARSRRDLAQRQPPPERAPRPQGRQRRRRRRAAAAAAGRRCRSPASAFSSLLVVVVWLASGFYIVDEGRRGVVTRFGKYTETTQPGAALAPAVPDRGKGARRLLAGEDGRGRLSQHAQEQEGERGADADGRREHHRHPVRRPVQPQERRSVSLQRPQARPHRRSSSRRPRWAKSSARRRWTSCCTRAASRSRSRPRS